MIFFQNPAQMATHGSGFCPRFRSPVEPLLIPNNVPRKIRLEVENLPRQVKCIAIFYKFLLESTMEFLYV